MRRNRALHLLVFGAQAVHVLGFGTDREAPDAPLSAYRLREIVLQAVEPGYSLGSDQKFWLDQSRGGICGGDSGGPAVVKDGKFNVVIGLAIHTTFSDGATHCLTKAAFTDVLFFRDWIRDAMNELRAH